MYCLWRTTIQECELNCSSEDSAIPFRVYMLPSPKVSSIPKCKNNEKKTVACNKISHQLTKSWCNTALWFHWYCVMLDCNLTLPETASDHGSKFSPFFISLQCSFLPIVLLKVHQHSWKAWHLPNSSQFHVSSLIWTVWVGGIFKIICCVLCTIGRTDGFSSRFMNGFIF